MTFETGKKYKDVMGRIWRPMLITKIKGNVTVMTVVRYFVGGSNVYAHAIDEGDGTATVLLDDGFTTIYDEVVG